ncbi:restriction endonuclease [Luteimonas sp. SX5]|uniref:Restriction endonuclease n=1 Tax=Luteimonas galliterrae TaxID=2940486 RepID=A0ABT0MF98_9GAMM|nr:restriction endonuclease [Luteimonas galliterrae]MCL1633536.1 restriction endonuclease [Luteimonas galliterrae]
MSPLMLGLFCTLTVGAAATFYFWGVRRRQDESVEGIHSLSAMHWREFAGLVLEMLFRRGYSAAELHPLGSGDQSDILLKREDGVCVLSCKHGSAYRLGGSAVEELANSVRMNDAVGGIMVTPGSFAPEAYALARPQRIELIDGKTLWPEVEPLLPEPLRKRVQAYAAGRAKRGVGIGWTAALVAGLAIALLLPRSDGDTPDAPAAVAAPAPGTTATPKPVAASPQAAAAQTESQQEQRRKDAASAIAALPGVERALWSTQSTLSLDINSDQPDLWNGICGIIDRYEELRATRVQMNPPPNSGLPVRFKQCHTY